MKEKGVMKLYRLERNLYLKKIPFLPKIIKIFIRIIFSATIPYTCEIGIGTKLPHGGQGVVIHDNAKIGNNCKIGVNVVIGGKAGCKKVPNIGNDVVIGVNSVIIGDVTIENQAVIGAGSVVVKDVSEKTIVAGNPAKVIKKG